jgi:hypothetical protein
MSNEIDLDLDDSLNLDLGAEDASNASLPDLSDDAGMSLDLGDSSLELSAGGDDLSLPNFEESDAALDLTADSDESLQLGDGLASPDDEFNLDSLEQTDQVLTPAEEIPPLEDLANESSADDLQFSMNETSLEENIDFTTPASTPPAAEDDFAAKLAEIDSMLEDEPVVTNATATHDKTGDISADTLSALSQDDEEMFVAPAAPAKKDSGNKTTTHVRNQMAELDEMFEDSPKKSNTKGEATQVMKTSMRQESELIGMHGDELGRLAATISHLRDDRHSLVDKIETLERQHELDKRENLNLKSELEEKKIEISIIKKRFSQQLDEMKYNQQLLEEKKRLLEEKNSSFQKEYERLNHKVQIDIKKVQQREKELENQLDLLKVDAETQVRNRDNKILELKRKIDSLEFDLEQLSQKENRNRDDRFEVEEKMDKLMKTLRSAITILEGDEQQLKNFDFIKKNLDI